MGLGSSCPNLGPTQPKLSLNWKHSTQLLKIIAQTRSNGLGYCMLYGLTSAYPPMGQFTRSIWVRPPRHGTKAPKRWPNRFHDLSLLAIVGQFSSHGRLLVTKKEEFNKALCDQKHFSTEEPSLKFPIFSIIKRML